MGGWLEIWGVKLISTQVVVEVGVELGNIHTVFLPDLSLFKYTMNNWGSLTHPFGPLQGG